ncbi:unnamed protein product [Microthlaspi erraticum]|uniref:RRM domain-containing protein n=1 Tax=Microthlaspi erraticum TaxID=1685480 RepID=A0A6D2HVX5_9BRAS|nr:unnamed protein product [Microthlaspi erraticum]
MSKGVGFVEFSTTDESSAMLKMNGKMVGKKTIYVSLAQRKRKEERKLHLQPQFSNVVLPTPIQFLHQHPPIFSQAATSTTALPPFRGYNNFQPQIMFPPRLPNGFPTMHVPNFMVPQHFPPPPSAFLLPQSRQVVWNQY